MIQRHAVRLVLLLCLVIALCACGASQRTKALRVNLVALNTARDTTLAISKEREKQLYDSCNPPSCAKEEGYARVDGWQKKVDVVIKALDIAYRATHDAGLLGNVKSASDAGAAATRALALYEELVKEQEKKP